MSENNVVSQATVFFRPLHLYERVCPLKLKKWVNLILS